VNTVLIAHVIHFSPKMTVGWSCGGCDKSAALNGTKWKSNWRHEFKKHTFDPVGLSKPRSGTGSAAAP